MYVLTERMLHILTDNTGGGVLAGTLVAHEALGAVAALVQFITVSAELQVKYSCKRRYCPVGKGTGSQSVSSLCS